MKTFGKVLGLDFGSKRVGLASTDEGGEFALPREVLPNDEHLLEKVLEFIQREKIELVVIGESRNYAGEGNPILLLAEEFKKKLENEGIKVIFHPEILTTVEARRLQGNNELTDASAAALILKSYLDSTSSV